jgi:hypothetical protein
MACQRIFCLYGFLRLREVNSTFCLHVLLSRKSDFLRLDFALACVADWLHSLLSKITEFWACYLVDPLWQVVFLPLRVCVST